MPDNPLDRLTNEAVSRRDFLKIAGVAGAAIGVGARSEAWSQLAARLRRAPRPRVRRRPPQVARRRLLVERLPPRPPPVETGEEIKMASWPP